MKRITLTLLALILAFSFALCFVSCEKNLFQKPDETIAGNTDSNGTTAVQNDVITDGTETDETDAKEESVKAEGLWEKATYLSDTTVGEGSKTVSFTVEAEGQKITITLKTDKATLGEAMFEHKLINDASFFNVLNGIEASWEKDQAYWAFYEGDDYMMVGVNDTQISGGEAYRFVYTK